MKLYATIENENFAKVSKGGDEKLIIGLNVRNKNMATVEFTENEIKIWYEKNHFWIGEFSKSQKQKGEKRCSHCGAITKTSLEGWHCSNCGRDN